MPHFHAPGLRQHYRPSRFRTPGWLRQLWVWL
ncbi:MAG: hypothetical protein RL227_1032 [Pseudomonadota bacterium]|jgi:hypothetical protein